MCKCEYNWLLLNYIIAAFGRCSDDGAEQHCVFYPQIVKLKWTFYQKHIYCIDIRCRMLDFSTVYRGYTNVYSYWMLCFVMFVHNSSINLGGSSSKTINIFEKGIIFMTKLAEKKSFCYASFIGRPTSFQTIYSIYSIQIEIF